MPEESRRIVYARMWIFGSDAVSAEADGSVVPSVDVAAGAVEDMDAGVGESVTLMTCSRPAR